MSCHGYVCAVYNFSLPAKTVCYTSPPSHLTLITSIRFQNDFGTCMPLYGTTISDSGLDGDNIFSIYFCAFPSHHIRSLFLWNSLWCHFHVYTFCVLHAHLIRIEVKFYSETEIKEVNLSQFDIGRFKSYVCIKGSFSFFCARL